MQLDLVPLWAAILSLGVLMYVLLDGFDLGVGILFLLRRDRGDRDLMVGSVAPIWDFNETWLVLGGTCLFAVFPLAFAIILPALYFPILVMLLGLLFRGVAFEFRGFPHRLQPLWEGGFGWGSLAATLAQGAVLGNFVAGFPVVGRSFAGSSWGWIAPFPLACSVGLAVGYALLGATWLVLKTEGSLQDWARRMARRLLVGLLAFIALVSVWTPLSSPHIAARWFTWPDLAWFVPVPLLTAALAWGAWQSLARGGEILPFTCSVGLFFLSYSGLLISLWPYVVPPSITLWDAATAPMAQQFLAVGTLFFLPILLLYVLWSYYVFRGKVRGDLYHHA